MGGRTINGESDSDESDQEDFVNKLLESANKEYFDILGVIWGISNPTAVLEECIAKEDWFKGVVLSTTFFEGIGAKVLYLRFGTEKEVENVDGLTAKKIGNLSLNTIIILLYALRIVDHPTYLRMMGVKEYRNKLVHELSPFAKPEPNQSKRMIKTAVKCLHGLIGELREERREFLLRPKKR